MQFTDKERDSNIRLLLLIYYKFVVTGDKRNTQNLKNIIVTYIAGTKVLLDQSQDHSDSVLERSKETFFDLSDNMNRELNQAMCAISKIFTLENVKWDDLSPLSPEDLI